MQQLAHLLQDHEYKEAIPLPLNTLSLSITSAHKTAVKIHNPQSKTTKTTPHPNKEKQNFVFHCSFYLSSIAHPVKKVGPP